MFRQCPRRWKFRYVDRLPDPPGQAALAGTFAHSVLEGLMQMDKGERTFESVRGIAKREWPKMERSPAFQALGLDADAVRAFKWQSWEAITGLWDLEDPRAVDVDETELRVRVELGGVPFLGYVDRIEIDGDEVVISDYKSGRPPPPRFESRSIEQVLLYAAAIAEMESRTPARVRLMYLGRKIIEAEVTAEAIDDVVDRLQETWADILEGLEKRDFPAKPTRLCGWCVFSEHCPEGTSQVMRDRNHIFKEIHAEAV